jgi:hypothetical protein
MIKSQSRDNYAETSFELLIREAQFWWRRIFRKHRSEKQATVMMPRSLPKKVK